MHLLSNQDFLSMHWPMPPGVWASMSTRQGGHSQGVWRGLNLGNHVGDEAIHVRRNRQALSQALKAQPVFLQQVHGTEVLHLDASHRLVNAAPVADACVTTTAGLACTVLVADCLPLLLASRDGRVVGAAHAGWRGLCHGVIEQTVRALQKLGADATELSVWLGPCIGPQVFEVGAEVRAAFVALDPAATAAFVPLAQNPSEHYLANLPLLARQRLNALGVGASQIFGNDGSRSWCTVSNPDLFFSYRREPPSGRMAACIGIRA